MNLNENYHELPESIRSSGTTMKVEIFKQFNAMKFWSIFFCLWNFVKRIRIQSTKWNPKLKRAGNEKRREQNVVFFHSVFSKMFSDFRKCCEKIVWKRRYDVHAFAYVSFIRISYFRYCCLSQRILSIYHPYIVQT